MNEKRSQAQGTALGFLAGYVDTLGFLALFGLFTAHVTGNFILIGAALADSSRNSILLKWLAFPAFIAGVALARILVVLVERRHGPALRPALLLELVLLLGFMGFGIAATPVGTEAGPLAMAAGLLGAAGMGAHSATSRLLLGHLVPTSMMTGNVTQIVIDIVDLLRGADDPGLKTRFAKFLWPLLAFAAGCVAAAFAFHWFGFAALVLPALILVGLLVSEKPAAASQPAAQAKAS
ncbi:YoaK family protein [Massilia suwonensis]|uniref:YoaK family protein n=1 Tax=Massilia suwonensis TaxID=648895 RepID=A0ABW0MQC3_9BURK